MVEYEVRWSEDAEPSDPYDRGILTLSDGRQWWVVFLAERCGPATQYQLLAEPVVTGGNVPDVFGMRRYAVRHAMGRVVDPEIAAAVRADGIAALLRAIGVRNDSRRWTARHAAMLSRIHRSSRHLSIADAARLVHREIGT